MQSTETEKTYEEKMRELFEQQVAMLKRFRKTGAISEAQFQTSYNGLVEKMGMTELEIQA